MPPGVVSTAMGASTSSVTEVAPLPHPRRSNTRNRTRGPSSSGMSVSCPQARRGTRAEGDQLRWRDDLGVRAETDEEALEPRDLADGQHDFMAPVGSADRGL